jgi:hypothetical protein
MTLPQYRGKVYTRQTFLERVAALKWQKGWRPSYIVQHSTGAPTLSDVMKDPNNHLSRLLNMELDYERRLHWTHTPHLFIFPPYPGQDDGLILEMNDLEVRGTHSSCDNANSIGVEHVGYYSPGHDDWSSGTGAKVRDLGVFAMAALYKQMGIDPGEPLVLHQKGHHFHCMCKADGHSICPGPEIDRDDIVKRLLAEIAAQKTPVSTAPPSIS